MKIILIFLAALIVTYSWAAKSDELQSAEQELKAYYFAAARMNDVEVLKEFTDAGFPVNSANSKGYTALMIATYHGNAEAFHYLISREANTCLSDMNGNTALMAAIFRGEFSMAKTLLSYQCNSEHKNNAGNRAEDFAEIFGRVEILSLLKR